MPMVLADIRLFEFHKIQRNVITLHNTQSVSNGFAWLGVKSYSKDK